MKIRTIIRFALSFWMVVLASGTALCGGIYLVAGVGAEGVLELGQQMESPGPGRLGEWRTTANGLRFKVDKKGRVVLIACDKRHCATDRNVVAGMRLNVVFQRYGAPIDEKKLKDGTFYRYRGTGFKIQDGVVREIYVFPR